MRSSAALCLSSWRRRFSSFAQQGHHHLQDAVEGVRTEHLQLHYSPLWGGGGGGGVSCLGGGSWGCGL